MRLRIRFSWEIQYRPTDWKGLACSQRSNKVCILSEAKQDQTSRRSLRVHYRRYLSLLSLKFVVSIISVSSRLKG